MTTTKLGILVRYNSWRCKGLVDLILRKRGIRNAKVYLMFDDTGHEDLILCAGMLQEPTSSARRKWKCCISVAMVAIRETLARDCPTQLRGPSAKGKYRLGRLLSSAWADWAVTMSQHRPRQSIGDRLWASRINRTAGSWVTVHTSASIAFQLSEQM